MSVSALKIPNDRLRHRDLADPKEAFACEVRRFITEARRIADTDRRLYLFTDRLPEEGVDAFVSGATRICGNDHLRFLFLLDATRKFTPTDAFYREAFERDLMASAYKHGEWGIYVSSLLSLSTVAPPATLLPLDVLANEEASSAKSCVLKYVCVEPRDFSTGGRREYVGYSGTCDDGTRLMGVARLESGGARITADPQLRWSIPGTWSLADAATVPYHFALAYHALVEIAQLEPMETVLIHDACSGFGQAALLIASQIGALVYVTVRSERQRVHLRTSSRQLLDHHILDANSCDFESHLLLATKGEGAHVILNCFHDERLRPTIRCLGLLGRIVHLRVSIVLSVAYPSAFFSFFACIF